MPSNARIGDVFVGQCCCHPPAPCIGMAGVIVTGDSTVVVNGIPSARLTDIVIGSCGHVGTIVSGSSSVNASNLPKARIGDAVSGCLIGTIVSGSPDVITGG